METATTAMIAATTTHVATAATVSSAAAMSATATMPKGKTGGDAYKANCEGAGPPATPTMK
jgi:hypothetical protein